MHPQLGKQEPVGGDPTGRLQHEQSPAEEMRGGRRRGQRRQGRAQGFGLPAKAARPELAALVRHVGLRGDYRGFDESAAFQKASDQEPGDHRHTEAKIGQGKLRQQRDGALTAPAEIAAHTDNAVKTCFHEGAAVKAVGAQRMLSIALRAMVGPAPTRISQRFLILLERAGERV
jgi:hypothetical protein